MGSSGKPEPQKITIALVDTFSPDFYIHTYSPTLDQLIETLPQFIGKAII